MVIGPSLVLSVLQLVHPQGFTQIKVKALIWSWQKLDSRFRSLVLLNDPTVTQFSFPGKFVTVDVHLYIIAQTEEMAVSAE